MSVVLENLSNSELLEKFVGLSAEHLNVLREFYSRLNRGKISNSEFERFQEISENEGVALIDLLPQTAKKQTVERTITDAVSGIVKKAYDTNR